MIHSKRQRALSLVVSSLVVALGSGLSGCRHERHDALPPPDAAPFDAPDQLAEGELLETSDEAFGLALPEGLRITKRLYSNVVLVGARPSSEIIEYLRQHVEAKVESGVGTTTFVDVSVKKPRSDWRGSLRIEVSRQGETTRVELWGEVPPPLPDNSGRTLPSWFQSGSPPKRASRDR